MKIFRIILLFLAIPSVLYATFLGLMTTIAATPIGFSILACSIIYGFFVYDTFKK